MDKKMNVSMLMMITGGVLVVGAFLPWVSVGVVGFNVSASGLQVNTGYITLASGALLGICGWMRQNGKPVVKNLKVATVIVLGIGLLLSFLRFFQLSGGGAGIGLFLTVLAGGFGLFVVLVLAPKEYGASWLKTDDPGAPAGGGGTPPPPASPGM